MDQKPQFAGAAAGRETPGPTAAWLAEHRQLYDQATRHPFIASIRDGTVDLASFKRWLGQDYLFVRGFVPFVANVLLLSCKESDDCSDMETILGGLASLSDELAWFKKEASVFDVDAVNTSPMEANLEYCRFLKRFMTPEISYAVAAAVFWAVETVYQDSFSSCIGGDHSTPKELLGACQRWGNSEFKNYCMSLRRIADRCLQKASADVVREAEEAFARVLELEIGFWNMSSTAS